MMDANQVWDVDEAIAAMRELAAFDPWWIEEPTSPDDVLGHARIREAVAPIAVATGEHVQNRIIFKQLLQAGAIDVLQIDACRVAGVNEVIAILLLAAKFGVPVCPHAGGVGSVRVRAAPGGVRLPERERLDRGTRHRVGRPPPRALRASRRGRRRALPASGGARLQHRDARRRRLPTTRIRTGAIWSGDEALVD